MEKTSAANGSPGRTLIDGLLVVALAAVLVSIGVQAMGTSQTDARKRLLEKEAKRVYAAMNAYFGPNQGFPNSFAEPRLNGETLDPLAARGYYEGNISATLAEGRVDAYESPDDQGLNQEFWMELTLRDDPGVRYLVARSDNAPASGGVWVDGVFAIHNGKLEKLP